jgi:PA14 domain
MCVCLRDRNARFFLVAVAWLAFQTSDGRAQQNPATLPAGWQQMPPTDFASAIRTLFMKDAFKTLTEQDQEAAKSRGKELFLQVNLTNTTLNYQTLEMLHWLARYLLDQTQIEAAQNALLGRQDNWAGQPYAEIRAKVVMMMRLEIPEPTIINEGRRWIQAGGTRDQVPAADMKYDIVRDIFTDLKVLTGSFSVQWTGLLNPRQTGNYTFAISPINVNSPDPRYPVSFSSTVSIAGNVIINATSNNWVTQSKPVNLTANQPVALQMTISAIAPRIPTGSMHAQLYWQGPGITKSVIPAANLSLSDGRTPGLQGIYNWKQEGQPQTLTRTDSVIDFAWTNWAILLSQDTSIQSQACDAMWQSMTAPDFITAISGPPAQVHPFLKDADDASPGLSSNRRQASCNLLLQNPTLLDPVDAKHAVGFYQAFRIGNVDTALDVIGQWAAQHADLAPALALDPVFDGDTRNACRDLATYTTQQLPDQVTRLQNEKLQLPDGRCSLPIAYALAFSYLGRGKINNYVVFLNNRLLDGTLTGDARVNWLIARAMAEEIRLSPADPYAPADSRPTDGRAFLDQAIQSAVTPAVKARVLQEIVARLAATLQFQAAQDLIQQSVSSFPDAQKAMLASWQQQLDALAATAAQRQQAKAAAAQQAYIGSLKARQAQAAAQGDTATVNRYNALIQSASSPK